MLLFGQPCCGEAFDSGDEVHRNHTQHMSCFPPAVQPVSSAIPRLQVWGLFRHLQEGQVDNHMLKLFMSHYVWKSAVDNTIDNTIRWRSSGSPGDGSSMLEITSLQLCQIWIENWIMLCVDLFAFVHGKHTCTCINNKHSWFNIILLYNLFTCCYIFVHALLYLPEINYESFQKVIMAISDYTTYLLVLVDHYILVSQIINFRSLVFLTMYVNNSYLFKLIAFLE